MKKILLGLMLALGLNGAAMAAGGGFPLDKAPQRTNDMAALQNGAKLFVNYCLSCHSASFMRYNRLRDIGLTDKQIAENLTFTTDKIGDTMKANINPKEAKAWFGANPPDLTLVARSRSSKMQAPVPTTSTPCCAPTTATTPSPLAGTTWCSPTSACRIRCGNCRASANRC
jgi:ubiquinol-cytochrome c reductase cytochrome c1 subunit